MLTSGSETEIRIAPVAITAPSDRSGSDLWGQIKIPSLAWARQHPEKLMAFLMVAQIDFPELSEMLK